MAAQVLGRQGCHQTGGRTDTDMKGCHQMLGNTTGRG